MADPVTIKLRRPVKFGERTVAQLTIRPLKAKDLRKMKDGSPMQQSLNMASTLSGEIEEVIDELEGEDLGEVLAVVNRFFELITPTTGDKA